MGSRRPRDQFPNFLNEINRHFHHRVSGAFECSFVLGYGLFVALRFVVIQNPLDPNLIPPGWNMLPAHRALLRL